MNVDNYSIPLRSMPGALLFCITAGTLPPALELFKYIKLVPIVSPASFFKGLAHQELTNT